VTHDEAVHRANFDDRAWSARSCQRLLVTRSRSPARERLRTRLRSAGDTDWPDKRRRTRAGGYRRIHGGTRHDGPPKATWLHCGRGWPVVALEGACRRSDQHQRIARRTPSEEMTGRATLMGGSQSDRAPVEQLVMQGAEGDSVAPRLARQRPTIGHGRHRSRLLRRQQLAVITADCAAVLVGK